MALYDVADFSKPAFQHTKFELLKGTVDPPPLAGGGTLPRPRLPGRVAWTALEFSPDERFIALATADRGVLLTDSFYPGREYALLAEHPIDPATPSGISWSPCGQFLAVGGSDGHVYTYETASCPYQLGSAPNSTVTGAQCCMGRRGGGGAQCTGRCSAPPKPLHHRPPVLPSIPPPPPPRPLIPARAEVQPLNPGFWTPGVGLLGEAHKSPAARAAARRAAAEHGATVQAAMRRQQQGLQEQAVAAATAQGIALMAMPQAPPTPVPSLPGPHAGSADEQASRMEGPVRCVRFHPRLALLGSAASAVAVWVTPE